MTAPYPIGFVGNGITRIFVLPVPAERIRALLPNGIELADQDVTAAGTHPVMFLFQKFSQCQFSIPLPLPSMHFQEHTICIPFTCVRSGYGPPGGMGPYCFMPKLYLTDLEVMLGGLFVWGYDKEMARIQLADRDCVVTHQNGNRLARLSWSGEGDFSPASEREDFRTVRDMLHQRLISAMPAAIGPWLVLTDFDRQWNMAKVRSLQATLELSPAHLRAFQPGSYESDGPEASCAFELHSSWFLSLPYSAMLPVGFMPRPAPSRPDRRP